LDDLKKYQNSLYFIFALLVVKFIFVPLMAWQDNEFEKINLKKRQHVKVSQLIDQEEAFREEQVQLEKQVNTVKGLFFAFENVSSFQLNYQQKIEADIAAAGIDINSVGWKAQFPLEASPLNAFQLELNLTGKADKMFAYLLALKNQPKLVDFEQLKFSFRNQSAGKLGNVIVRLRISLYMLAAE
jgi:hypothetical protein